MSCIGYALNDLMFKVPQPVLREAFKPNSYAEYYSKEAAPISIQEEIMNRVVRPRVLMDANLVGGQTVNIPLAGVPYFTQDYYTQVYRIPKEVLGNKTILSVLSVGYMPFNSMIGTTGVGAGNVSTQSLSDVSVTAQRLGDAVSSTPSISTARAELIAENTVMIVGIVRHTQAYTIRCVLANDEELNNINPRSYKDFATLIELAVKSYIYNTMRFKIDRGFLEGGQELGIMKTYVEELNEAEAMYQTHLTEVWAKVAFMNNIEDNLSHIRLQLSPQL